VSSLSPNSSVVYSLVAVGGLTAFEVATADAGVDSAPSLTVAGVVAFIGASSVTGTTPSAIIFFLSALSRSGTTVAASFSISLPGIGDNSGGESTEAGAFSVVSA